MSEPQPAQPPPDSDLVAEAELRRAFRRRAILAAAIPAGVTLDAVRAAPGLAVGIIPGMSVIAIGVGVMLNTRRYAPQAQRWPVVVAWVAATVAAGYSVQERVGDLGPFTFPVAVAAMWLVAGVAWRVAAPDPLPDDVRPEGRRRHRLAAGDAWTRIVWSPAELRYAVGWAVGAVLYALPAFGGRPIIAAGLAALVLLSASQAPTRLEVDAVGVHLSRPLRRRPLLSIRLADVVDVRVADGVGSLSAASLPDRLTGLLWRGRVLGYRDRYSGATLHLQLASGRDLLVTLPLDVAQAAAAAITARRSSSTPKT